jgi:hypothetical protein
MELRLEPIYRSTFQLHTSLIIFSLLYHGQKTWKMSWETIQVIIVYKIWGFHSSEGSCYVILGYDTM